MRTRSISSVGVVVVGLVPTLVGGPAFAALMTALGLVGYREYLGLAERVGGAQALPTSGYLVVAALAASALAGGGEVAVVALVAAAVAAPLVGGLGRSDEAGVFAGWGLTVAGTLYLGLPVFAAIVLRQSGGTVEAGWLAGAAEATALGWAAAPRGLAWVLVVIVVTWLGDSAAYLVGRAWGRRRLAPRLSPNKTLEGSIGGLVAATIAGGVCVPLFGLGISPLLGAGIGAGLGIVGQLGDLAESLLKRQAGVKDSGALIPGHGGILDRVDAQLFAFPAGWLFVDLIDHSLG